jgi:hypothetical protein
VGVNKGVGVMVGVGVAGVIVAVGVMLVGAVADGVKVVPGDGMSDGVIVAVGVMVSSAVADGVTDGMAVGPVVARGTGVSPRGTGLDRGAAGTDGNAATVGVGVTVELSRVGVVPSTMVVAGGLPQAARVFRSMMTSMSTIRVMPALPLCCRPRGRFCFWVSVVIFRCKSCQRWFQLGLRSRSDP